MLELFKALRVTLEDSVSNRCNVTEKQDVRCTCVTMLPTLVTYRGDDGATVYGGETHIRRAHAK